MILLQFFRFRWSVRANWTNGQTSKRHFWRVLIFGATVTLIIPSVWQSQACGGSWMNMGMVWVLILPKFINLGLKFILGSTPPGSYQTPASPHLHPFASICTNISWVYNVHVWTRMTFPTISPTWWFIGRPYQTWLRHQSCGDSPNISEAGLGGAIKWL